jgi:hypothetical protein
VAAVLSTSSKAIAAEEFSALVATDNGQKRALRLSTAATPAAVLLKGLPAKAGPIFPSGLGICLTLALTA